MEFEIVMKNSVYEEIFALMSNVDQLNNGDEIGGWLLGDWKHDKEQATLVLDQFIIPKQDVTGSEVDISPESMADTLREIGPEACNRICAHWHIHPFGKGSTNWSSIDEDKINDFMDPDKGRELFVFLLSSEDQLKARVELNIKGTINLFEKEFTIREKLDDLSVKKETEAENSELFAGLKKRIDEKVTRKTFSYGGYGEQTTLMKKENLFEIEEIDGRIHLRLDENFAGFIEESGLATPLVMNPTKVKMKKDKEYWRYDVPKKKLDETFDKIKEEVATIEQEYLMCIEDTDSSEARWQKEWYKQKGCYF